MYAVFIPLPDKILPLIEHYRQKCDPLTRLMPAHLVLVEPFQFSGSVATLDQHLAAVSQDQPPIKVFLAGWHMTQEKGYTFSLPLTTGRFDLTGLRRRLLTGPLAAAAEPNDDYWPCVSLGRAVGQAALVRMQQALTGFNLQFSFRVKYLELWQRELGQAWWPARRFSLGVTSPEISSPALRRNVCQPAP